MRKISTPIKASHFEDHPAFSATQNPQILKEAIGGN